MIRAGPPWSDALKARRDAILAGREAARSSADPPSSWPSLAEFYAGRGVLLTGGSGFMGRVLLEFLLRCCPDVGAVFLVLRARRGVGPEQRLRQLTDVPLFDRLRAEQPGALSKVVVVAGDVALPGLGLSAEDRAVLARHVSVVFHCAASVRFDDPFRKAVFTNLRSTRDLVRLARELPQLKVLVHLSTAYAFTEQPVIGERVYPTHLDWREAIRWAEGLADGDAQRVDWLGHKVRGFQPNTYTLTKGLAERLLEDEASDLPVVIARPSMVIGSYSDPLPGWVDNLNGPMALWAAGAVGLLKMWPHGNAVMDTVPVDVATKIVLLASWLKGIGKPLGIKGDLPKRVDVVNVTVGTELGPSVDEYVYATESKFVRKVPYPSAVRWPKGAYATSSRDIRFKLTNLYSHIMFGGVLDLLARLSGVKPRALKIYRSLTVAIQALEPFASCAFKFDMEGQEHIILSIHPSDEKTVDYVDILKARDTRDRYDEVLTDMLRGVLKYALREEDNPKKNLPHLQRVYWYEVIYHLFMLALLGGVVYIVASLKYGAGGHFANTITDE